MIKTARWLEKEEKEQKQKGKEKQEATAEVTTGAEAIAAACSRRHNLPTGSHGSTDKYRLTSQLKT